MRLSAEQFMELVNPKKAHDNLEVVDGHRRARRIPFLGMVEMQPIVGRELGPKMTVRLRDISARGLAVLDKWTAAEGSQFIASLARTVGRPLRILCTVSYSARLPGDLFRTGAEITCILPNPKPADAAVPEARLAVAAAADPGATDRIRKSVLG